jgi:hypothetical protein
MNLFKFKIGALAKHPAVSAEPSDYATLRFSPWSVVKERQSLQVGELPDEVGDEATSLQGLGEIALPCYLLFFKSKTTQYL